MPGNAEKTEAIVLRRTNFGETDRILNLLTPGGKKSCLAKGVRKEKSKLAGGVEMFCLSEVVLHAGKNPGHNTLTAARMVKFYGKILGDLERLELASDLTRRVSRITDQVDSPEYFGLLKQTYEGLDAGMDLGLVETWFNFNFVRIRGDQVNLVTDTTGAKLSPEEKYVWDSTEGALKVLPEGRIEAVHIKLMRLFWTSPLLLVSRVKGVSELLPEVSFVARAVSQQ